MRSTFTVFVTYLVVIVAGLVVYTAIGFVRHAEDPAPARAAGNFAQALDARDGARACGLLTPDAQDALEQDRKKPCDRGVIEVAASLKLQGRAGLTEIAERSAIVTTQRGDALFLDQTPAGWRVSAAGCRPQAPALPYECELE